MAADLHPESPSTRDSEGASDAEARPREMPPLAPQENAPVEDAGPDFFLAPSPVAWRQEVAAREDRYHSRRRPSAPRSPSLELEFESTEVSGKEAAVRPPSGTLPPAAKAEGTELAAAPSPISPVPPRATKPAEPSLAKVIEFPPAPEHGDELAEPIADGLRIFEGPEIPAPPPALGGILIPAEAETPLQEADSPAKVRTASVPRRLAALLIDAALVLLALALFALIVSRMTRPRLSLLEATALAVPVSAAFWYLYQWLLLGNTGSTPGLRVLRLQLARFDGSSAPRRLRRWRVLTSVLSGLSLGLGYLWCWLDSDGFCWHEKITETCITPRPPHTGGRVPPAP